MAKPKPPPKSKPPPKPKKDKKIRNSTQSQDGDDERERDKRRKDSGDYKPLPSKRPIRPLKSSGFLTCLCHPEHPCCCFVKPPHAIYATSISGIVIALLIFGVGFFCAFYYLPHINSMIKKKSQQRDKSTTTPSSNDTNTTTTKPSSSDIEILVIGNANKAKFKKCLEAIGSIFMLYGLIGLGLSVVLGLGVRIYPTFAFFYGWTCTKFTTLVLLFGSEAVLLFIYDSESLGSNRWIIMMLAVPLILLPVEVHALYVVSLHAATLLRIRKRKKLYVKSMKSDPEAFDLGKVKKYNQKVLGK